MSQEEKKHYASVLEACTSFPSNESRQEGHNNNIGRSKILEVTIMDPNFLKNIAPSPPEATDMNLDQSKSDSQTKSKAKKDGSKPKSNKTYSDMVHMAIEALNDRTGSSQIAIQKYMISEFKLENTSSFRSRVAQAIKNGLKNNRFSKVRASFKINAEWMKKDKLRKQRDRQRKAREKKKLEDQRKNNPEEAQGKKALERQLQQQKHQEMQKKKEESLRKERAERIRKRRFPMEDTKLYAEDKELNVKPPASVKRRPNLPYVFQYLERHTSNTAKPFSRCEMLDYDSRGLVSDMFQVYHFFQGDLRFSSQSPLVADFSLKQLMYATDEVLCGNAKKSKMVPPLITHLFVVSLNLLTNSPDIGETKEAKQLEDDLESLNIALNAVSWPDVCSKYMDCMERYYSTSASLEGGVLEPGYTDVNFLFRRTSEPQIPEDPGQSDELPDGYNAYLGDADSSLFKAYHKLSHCDPWQLTAEDLFALLRALTDDVISTKPQVAEELNHREEQLQMLLRNKRSADANLRKIKLAYEGPKAKPTSKKEDTKTDAKGGGTSKEEDSKKGWKRTASKRQYEQAIRQQEKAVKELANIESLNVRTEPIGFDRHFSRYHQFPQDPECIYVEMLRGTNGNCTLNIPKDYHMQRSTWHMMDKVSGMNCFISSLDVRGHRENALKDALIEAKKEIFDDVQDKEEKRLRLEKRGELEAKLEVLQEALRLEEENGGRRSGRLQLQSHAQLDFKKVSRELEEVKRKIEKDTIPIPVVHDFDCLTGLENLKKFEGGKRQTRRSRELEALDIKQEASSIVLPPIPCGRIYANGCKGTGLLGIIVSDLLKTESYCEALVPDEDGTFHRGDWVSRLESLVIAWNDSFPPVIGRTEKEGPSDDLGMVSGTPTKQPGNDSKRRRLDSPSTVTSNSAQLSPSQMIQALKKPILELEKRVFEATGLAMAEREYDQSNDYISVSSNEKEIAREEKDKILWKKKIHSLRSIPTKKYAHIRDAIRQAISAAGRAQLSAVVTALRKAMVELIPSAPSTGKVAAIKVLDQHGGYVESMDEDDEEDDFITDDDNEEEEEAESNLCAEAMVYSGSLACDDKVNRLGWIEAVKASKTFARLTALSTAFVNRADKVLSKLSREREALESAMKSWKQEERKKKPKSKSKSPSETKDQPSEVWTPVHFLDEFCMVKIDSYPYWPARRCKAKDEQIETALESYDRCLVAVVGEKGGLRVVRKERIGKFTGSVIDDSDLQKQDRKNIAQLEESIAIARRVIRAQQKEPPQLGIIVEEKKIAS